MQRIPPMVPLRALREAHGLTTKVLAQRIAEFGVDVHPDSLINIELGRKGCGLELRTAWAAALNIKAVDVRLPDELRDLVGGPETEVA